MNANSDTTNPMVHVTWLDDDEAKTEFPLDDLQSAAELAAAEDLWLDSVTSNCTDLGLLLDRLAPLANPELDEISVNEITVVVATRLGGGYCFVPYGSNEAGVELLGSGSASWLSGGPCVFDQREKLLRLGDFYWVDTRGDAEQQRVAVGRFTDEAQGLTAVVKASIFFSFDADGELQCELDNWPQDE